VTLFSGSAAFLALAAFFAGFVDSIAGGGGLVTLPALLATGLPPHLALATNKGQAIFGSATAARGYWKRGVVDRPRALPSFVCGLVGSFLGALAQLAVRPEVLRPVVIVLLVAAAVVVAWPRKDKEHVAPPHAELLSLVACFVLGAYDGFFGPGVGTMLIVAFVLLHGDTLTRASGNAKMVNVASNLAAFALFAVRGNILWGVALPMAAANAVGSWVGAHVAVKRGDRFIRVVVLAVVAALAIKLVRDLVVAG
jgi:uncharacterized membrane protein YfcA